MKKISLTQGKFALVDDEDYDFLMQWKWHVCSSKKKYAMRNSGFDDNGRRTHVMMHRVINKTPDGMETDHVNGNGFDNRRENIRAATRSQNQQNRVQTKKCTSKYKGVSYHKATGKWRSQIQINKKKHHLGLFDNKENARNAYIERSAIEFKNFNREITI